MQNHKGEDSSLLANNTLSWVNSTWYFKWSHCLQHVYTNSTSNTEAHPMRRNSWATPLCKLQMAQSDVCGKIHCGLDNRVSANRKQKRWHWNGCVHSIYGGIFKRSASISKITHIIQMTENKAYNLSFLCIFCTSQFAPLTTKVHSSHSAKVSKRHITCFLIVK